MWSAVAEAPTTVVLLSGRAVREIVATQPSLAMALIEGLIFKSRCYTAMLQMVGTQSKAARLAHVLLSLAEVQNEDGALVFPACLTHLELAKMIGATRQSVSSTLEQFERKGMISRSSDVLIIENRASLRRVCE